MKELVLRIFTLWRINKIENNEKGQHSCPSTYHVLREQEVFNLQGIECCCLLHIIQVFLYWIFVSTEIKETVTVTHIFWRHFVWWTIRNWHSWNVVEYCVLLWFIQEHTPANILTFRSKVVLYYPSKGFLMLVHNSQALKNIPTGVKKHIHAVDMHAKDSVITCNTAIPFVSNNLK